MTAFLTLTTNQIRRKIAPSGAKSNHGVLSPEDLMVLEAGLRAQARILPYALSFFFIGLPIFIWACIGLSDGLVFFTSLTCFGINWAVFYAVNARLSLYRLPEADPDRHAQNIFRLARGQFVCGLLWALSLGLISLIAMPHGRSAEFFLLVCAGAGTGVIFFCAPVLVFLLSIGLIAVMGPIFIFFLMGTDPDQARILTGAAALALAMGFVVNRHLIDHYRLEWDQKQLAVEREAALSAKDSLNDARIALMQTLSHDVFSGMKAVMKDLTQAQALLQRAPGPRDHVDQALSQIRHLQAILVTTLDSHTAEMGHLKLERAPLDIRHILSALEAEFSLQTQAKGLDLSLNLLALPDYGAALGDADRVKQILSHLCHNAIDYTTAGHIEISAALTENGYLRLSILDSGPGLSPEELLRAFKPHQRIDRTAGGHSGSGLGLSLSESLAHLMGAQLGADSKPGLGSRFWLDLSFDARLDPPKSADMRSDASLQAPHQSLHILIVQPDRLKSAQLRIWLERHDHKCLSARAFDRALSLLSKVNIDVVLLGHFTPEATEDSACAAFIDAVRRQETPILVTAPHAHEMSQFQGDGIVILPYPLGVDSLNRALTHLPPKKALASETV